MNYPIWEITTIGGGSLIALISILHVYISHLAVGGGAFIWLTDLKGYRENNPDIHGYVRKHTWFFLLLTMVFGGLTGVGIWFIISLVHPAGTSKLIHAFVFGWAIEWVFFVGEIVSLLIYHYQFENLGRKSRLTLAFLYFLFAWLSLVVINGIIAFMLTPGKWLTTQYFWHGFFNPTYFSSLFFRTFIALMFAGLFGYVTTVFLKESEFRTRMMKYCSKWLLYPMLGLVPTAIWYYFSIPADVRHIAFDLNPQTNFFVYLLVISTVLIFAAGIYFSLKSRPAIQKALTFVLVIIGLLWIGGFEYVREISRKPFVINKFMYSTSIMDSEVDRLNSEGLLKHAKWTSIKAITTENKIEAGKELFRIQCLSCHTIDGIRNDISPRTEQYPYFGTLAQLEGQGKILSYMPKFVGTQQEKQALAAYITAELHGKEIVEHPEPYQLTAQEEEEIPPFDSQQDQYILLAWNDLGMHCVSDANKWFVILPPANTLEAILIKRGEVPELITEGVEISYAVEPGFENPAKHVDFWKYSRSNFGVDLEENIGLAGLGMNGKFEYNEQLGGYIARSIPVVPYADNGSYNPFPLFKVEARDAETGERLATTKVVAPTSTEMGCRNCHGGGWRWNDISGMSDETAINILKAHDRIEGTNLYQKANKGQPQLCQSCHADPALNAEGRQEVLNFSSAMHGWHANYMPVEGAAACALCHPANPVGNTRCNRGIHGQVGVTCVSCHGTMAEHALGLLKGQEDKKAVAQLMKNLRPQQVASIDEIDPRTPWLKEPDCLNCHVDFEKPEPGFTGYNQWTEGFEELYRVRTDYAGIRCAACHGSPHAEYPANNAYSALHDNIQPLQYTGEPYPIGANLKCETCHRQKMEYPVHHENMYRMMRNKVMAVEKVDFDLPFF